MIKKQNLFLIPARGGSKGLPRKNILPLGGKAMIRYTLEAAIQAAGPDDEVCVSTDDEEIKAVIEGAGVKVPFTRPANLASDEASTQSVIEHALDWYRLAGKTFARVILLQVTSPFRTGDHIKAALGHWNENLDMVVSVKAAKSNPYFTLFEENENGFLIKSKAGNYTRRQDCPPVWEYNGAIYIINSNALYGESIYTLGRIKKFVMDSKSSIDIDSELDFKIAEYLLRLYPLS